MSTVRRDTEGPEFAPHDAAAFRRPALAVTLITLGIYLLSLAPDLSWANGSFDGAELITASATLGVPHPPGYPTYVALGKLFSLIPFGTVAFRYNLFAAVCTAIAAGLVVLISAAVRPGIRPQASMIAALLFGFAPVVWNQATVAEVYSLNLLVVALFLLAWSRRGVDFTGGFWLGLALTTHLTAALWLPAFIWRGRRQWRRMAAGLALGLTPLLLLPWLGSGDSPVVWGTPGDPAGWLWLISGRLYTSNIHPGIDIARWMELLRAILFGPAVALAVAKTAGSDANSPSLPPTPQTIPTPSLLAGTALFHVLFALFYDVPDAHLLLLPAILILAVLVAPRLQRLGVAAWLLPIALVMLTFNDRDLHNQRPVRELALPAIVAAPEHALLLTPGDRTYFTLLYLQQIEGIRRDARLVDANLFAFDWYRDRLRARYPDLAVPAKDDLAALQRENSADRPFCLVGLAEPPQELAAFFDIILNLEGGAPYLSCVGDAD